MQLGTFATERLTPDQAAQYIGLARATLDTWRSRGDSPLAFYKIGRRVFYARTDLDAFVRRSRREAKSA